MAAHRRQEFDALQDFSLTLYESGEVSAQASPCQQLYYGGRQQWLSGVEPVQVAGVNIKTSLSATVFSNISASQILASMLELVPGCEETAFE